TLASSGTYYVVAKAQMPEESPYDPVSTNNCTRSAAFAFTPQPADVWMFNMAVTRPADPGLRTFTGCSFTIVNKGSVTITNEWIMIDYYLSLDTIFGNADDTKIGDTGMTMSMSPGSGWNISLSGGGLANMYRFWTEGLVGGSNYYVYAKGRVVDESPYDSVATNDYSGTASTILYRPEVPLTINGGYSNGFISVGGDADWYALTVPSTNVLTIDTQAGTLTDNYMYLYGPNNHFTLIEEDDEDGDGSMARIVRSLTPGTYYVKVEAYYLLTGTGTYTIAVSQ
ncbi:MAG: PPC domain-containing protein, partial [Lentisphaerota bacterium]